ncbi:NAD(P)-dependent oxidoreductase [Rhodococcus sp. NPDC057529]|uniref:NAD(P)-dependent oxidoreductase n=1 Tax=Rhodococcus sp. NPDC057529 TaxID=3346158 RepID=UPI00366C7F65
MGGIIDEQALAAVLSSGQLAGTGLDVFAHEPPQQDNQLLGRENVVLSPPRRRVHPGRGTTDERLLRPGDRRHLERSKPGRHRTSVGKNSRAKTPSRDRSLEIKVGA